MTRPQLIIFAKAPIMGRAKTRLAADIGVVHAKRLYRSMVSKVLKRVTDPRWDTVLAVTPPKYLNALPDWSGYQQIPQVTGSLSPRLSAVFQGQKRPVAVIGTDCPQIKSADIAEAFEKLKSHKAVFGPADDGGFWLMAMQATIRPAIFNHVNWSTETALEDVARNIAGSVGYLRVLTDVDNLAALISVRKSNPRLV